MVMVFTYSPFAPSLDTITTGRVTQARQTSSAEGKEWEEILPPALTSPACLLPSIKWVIVRVTENC